jgi:hypothetical protein
MLITNINNNKPPQISEHTKDSLVVNNATNINNNKPPQISEHNKDTTIYTDGNTTSGLRPAQNYCGVILVYDNKYKQTLINMHRDASTKELHFFNQILF